MERLRAHAPRDGRPDADIVLVAAECVCCGGYLGAPTVFGSFAEMVAYFYMVFTYAGEQPADEGAACGL